MKSFLVLVNILAVIASTTICFSSIDLSGYHFLKVSLLVLNVLSFTISILVLLFGTTDKYDRGKSGYAPQPFTPTNS